MSERQPRPIRSEAPQRPTITTLQEMQEVQGQFIQRVLPHETNSNIYDMIIGEVGELQEAMETGDRQEVASEIADVILLATKLASHYGINIEDAVSAKINRNYHKYNPYEVNRLVAEEGMTHRQAMQHRRQLWDRDKDKDFT